MVEADFLVDAVIGGGLADVVQDARPVCNRLRLGPWLERVTQREHVAVGTDAGITKQIPGAADGFAALQNDIALAGTILLQVIARTDARQPGADDQHVDMLVDHFHHSISPQAARKSTGKRRQHYKPRLSRNRRSCGRICSQPSSRSNLVIASTLGSARRRANRSAARAQASSIGIGSACACCAGATLGTLSTGGAGCRGGSVVAMLSNRRCTWAFNRTQESSR